MLCVWVGRGLFSFFSATCGKSFFWNSEKDLDAGSSPGVEIYDVQAKSQRFFMTFSNFFYEKDGNQNKLINRKISEKSMTRPKNRLKVNDPRVKKGESP